MFFITRNRSKPTETKRTILEFQGEKIFSALKTMENLSTFSIKLAIGGEEILDREKGARRVDWHQFALMHDASIIHRTEFEGGELLTTLKAWYDVFTSWQEEKGGLLPQKLKKDQIAHVIKKLEQIYKFYHLRPPRGDKPLSEEEIEEYTEKFLNGIKEELNEGSPIYLPLGYRHGLRTYGHVIMTKIVPTKKGILVYLLNQGSGSSAHPPITFTTTQERISYHFYPIFVSREDFFGELGKTAFGQVMRYLADPPSIDLPGYFGSDLYDIFLTLGEVQLDSKEDWKRRAANSKEDVWNCTAQAGKVVIRDMLVDMGLSRLEMDFVFANGKLLDLVAAYHTYQEAPKEKYRVLLRSAAEKFGLVFKKLESHFTYPEKVGVVSVLHQILEKTPPPSLAKKERSSLPEPMKMVMRELPKSFPVLDLEEGKKTPINASRIVSTGGFHVIEVKKPEFLIDRVEEELSHWVETMDRLPGDKKVSYLYDCTQVLPIPKVDGKSVWNQLSIEKGRKVVMLLQTLLSSSIGGRHCDYRNEDFTQEYFSIHTIYAIVDAIARRNPQTKLHSYCSPYTFNLSLLANRDFFHIPLSELNGRYEEIVSYFSHVSMGRLPIFPVQKTLHVGQYFEDLRYGRKNGCAWNHAEYLNQFLVNGRAPIDLWADMEGRYIPTEVSTLYYLANLSYSLLFKGENFPKALEFTEIVDMRGKLALKMMEVEELEREELVWSEGFCQMGEKDNKNHNDRFAEFFFSEKISRWRTNDAIVARISEKHQSDFHLTEPLFRDLLRLTRKKQLQIYLAVEWMGSHPIYLENSNVRFVLEHCLFAPGILKTAVENEPGFPGRLRKIIEDSLRFYRGNPSHYQTICFLLRIGMCLETFSPNEGENLESLIFYENELQVLEKNMEKGEGEKKAKGELFFHRLFLDLQKRSHTQEQIQDLILRAFQINQKSSLIPHCENPWIVDAVEPLYRAFLRANEEVFQDIAFVSKVCSEVILHFFPEKKERGTFSGEFPHFTNQEYWIDLLHLEVHDPVKGQLSSMALCDDRVSSLFNHHGGVDSIWKKDGIYRSKDGKIAHSFEEQITEREFVFRGRARWGILHLFSPKRVDPLNCHFLEHWGTLNWMHFALRDKEEGDPDLLTFEEGGDLPFLRIDRFEDRLEITKLDENGETLPIQLVYLQNIAQEHRALYQIANLLASPGEVVCFVNTETGEVEELNFFLIPLHFVQKEGRLACRQHPGFYLLPGHTLEELNHYSGAMVLANEDGEGKVFIPAHTLRLSSDPFSREVTPIVKKENWTFHSYELDPVEGSLLSSSPKANFYLGYLLKMQREYEKALYYVAKGVRLSDGKEEIFDSIGNFRGIQDPSPSSFAFNLQFLLKIIEARSLLQEEQLQEKEKLLFREKELISWTKEVFTAYLRMLSREDLSSIPKGLRLSKEEEKQILFYLKRKTKELPQLLQIRLDLLTRKGGEMTISIGEREVLLHPTPFKELMPLERVLSFLDFSRSLFSKEMQKKRSEMPGGIDPSRIRLHKNEVVRDFPLLYELARKSPALKKTSFDFMLLALLSVRSDSLNDGEPLSHLLFYVRHLSFLFEDLPLDERRPLCMQKGVFREILHRLGEWLRLPESTKILSQLKEPKGTFPYTAEIALQYPQPPERLPIPRVDRSAINPSSPFITIGAKLVKREVDSLSYTSFNTKSRKGYLEEEQRVLFQEGLKQLGEKEEVCFTLQVENLKFAEAALKEEKRSLLTELQQRRKDLHRVLNEPYRMGGKRFSQQQLKDNVELLFALESRQAEVLLPEKVMCEGVLKNDLNFWNDHRPQLSEEEVLQVVGMVKDYYHYLVLYEMAKEGCDLIAALQREPEDQEKVQSLARLLYYEFSYDPSLYPEIAYMKIKTGKLPRPEQVEIYLWVCEGMERGENRLFQLHAGGGKTSYLTPLLMLRARMEGFLPAFGSTQAIYSVDKENLGKILGVLGCKLTYLEVGMHMKLSADDLHHIFNQLRIYREQGDGLILTPQIVYTLHLLYRFAALKEQDSEKVKWASLILAFFKKRVFFILDESHRNLDALTRAIYGVGEKEYLPEKELELFLSLMMPLIGLETVHCEDQREVAEVIKLKENSQGIPPKNDLLLVRKTLARRMINSPLLEIPPSEQEAYLSYWTEKRGEVPRSLSELGERDRPKADLIALTRYFLQDLLQQVAESRTELDHAPSIYPDEEFDTPCHHKTPSTAQFEDPYRTVALSIKGAFHRGLTDVQVIKLITKLLESDRREQEQMPELTMTLSGEKFRAWVAGTSMEGKELRDLNLTHLAQTGELTGILRKHPSAIREYLLKFILPQIASSDAQICVTPVHLLDTFAQSVSFSATPYLSAVYPRLIDSFKYDPTFEAHVVAEFSEEKNQNYLFPKTTEPTQFFLWLHQKERKISEETTILNDPGGFFCDYANVEVAKGWLHANSKLDGVVYFKEARSLSVDSEQTISLLLRGKKEAIEIRGSDLKHELRKIGYDWDEICLGSYYDAAHTESTDIPQKADAKMLLFGGDSLAYSHLIQALMRARGFLDSRLNQTVCWVFHEDLAKTIHPERRLCGKQIFAWTQKNEVREMKKRVILAAYQEISFHVEEIAMCEIREALSDPDKQIKLMQIYSGGFQEKIPHDPFGRHGEPTSSAETAQVLTEFAKTLYARFGYSVPYETNRELQKKIGEICRQASEILIRIPTQITKKISSQIEQHESKIKRLTEKEEYRPRPFDPISIEGVYGNFGIANPDYPSHSKLRKTSREVFRCNALTGNLYFEENQLRTAKESGIPLDEKLLKPIDFFLIIHHEGETWAEAITNEIQATFLNTLRSNINSEYISHSAFLVTSEGTLVQEGRGSLAPPEGLVEKVQASQWFQDLLIDAALLRGQVRFPDRLLERLKTWDDFPAFWARIVEAQPNPETANQFVISRLLSQSHH